MAYQKVISLNKRTVVTDWEKVVQSADAAIIRIGYRGDVTGQLGEDPKFRSYLAACQCYNLPYVFYFCSTAISEEEAVEEAKWITDRVPNTPDKRQIVYISTDTSGRRKVGRSEKLTKEERTKLIKLLCETIKSAGVSYGIYDSASWITEQLDMNELTNYPVWVIQYSMDLTYKYNGSLFWQYTTESNFPGISGKVDVSREMPMYLDIADSVSEKVVQEEPEEPKVDEVVYLGIVNTTAEFLKVRNLPSGIDTGKRIPRGKQISYDKIQNGWGRLTNGDGWVDLKLVKE